ncbi:MAG: hypothetical protein KF704_13035 [Crocinitomicaceae bacterium]|nr:hypothetical protein [Crocinitomicaceae bacterium]
MKLIKILLFAVCFIHYSVFSQEYKCYSCETGYPGEYFEIFTLQDSIIIRDTVRDTVFLSMYDMEKATKSLGMSFDEFVHNFLTYVNSRDSSTMTPEEKKHISYLRAMMNAHLKKDRYVLREYTAHFARDSFSITMRKMPEVEQLPDSMDLDFLFILEGEKNTDNFLHSHKKQVRVLYQILKDIKGLANTKHHKIGINFYFPDFSFQEKRAMAQFIKSVSLVIDSIKIKEIRGIPLYFTFDQSVRENSTNYHYLVSMSDMVDSIFLAKTGTTSSSSLEISFTSIDHKKEKSDIPWLQQIRNQFYLARFHTDDFPKISDQYLTLGDLEKLMTADYPDSHWEYYFYSILTIVLILIAGSTFYFLSSTFANFVHNNAMYVFAGGILLVLEMYLLFVFMIETMSNTVVFDFQENQIVLFLPLLLIFVIPLIKNLVRKGETP